MFRSKSLGRSKSFKTHFFPSASESKDLNKICQSIDNQIKKDAAADQATIKLLLLGASECGKSTVLKQMRYRKIRLRNLVLSVPSISFSILHDNGFKAEEYDVQKHIIHDNVLDAMLTLIDAVGSYGLQFSETSNVASAEKVRSAGSQRSSAKGRPTTTLEKDVVEAIASLWVDDAIRKCYAKAAELQLYDSTQYLMENLQRIGAPDYSPSEQDILRSRVSTMGIIETVFNLQGMKFRVFDVGGQRAQRRKWIHCFDNVNAVIFIVAVSEYDQMLREDTTMNRIHEARILFNSILNCVYFKKKNFILFLNKRDVFAEKIARKIPITIAFPKFDGKHDYDTCMQYIAEKFVHCNLTPERSIFTHQTCGTDTNQVQVVLDNCLQGIVEERLTATGMLS